MKKILITGISGFAGSFLAEHLIRNGSSEIFGTTLSLKDSPNLIYIKDKISLYQINLMEREKVFQMLEEIQPDAIFHLAALASASLSFANPLETISNNISAQIHILDAVRMKKEYKPRILIVSSADVYGLVKKDQLPINEMTQMNPTNPYAVSKIAQDYLALQYFHTYKLPIIRVRPFNHIGPRQAVHFVVADFAKKIADIEKKKCPPVIRVGNLDSKRDFTDVRDMVAAYGEIVEKGTIGEVYNIGSGVSYRIHDILKMLMDLSTEQITVETDPNKIRPADNPELLCDAVKIRKITGWETKIPLQQTLKDTLDYWRNIR